MPMQSEVPAPDGLKIVELATSGIAAGYAARLLMNMGASVTRWGSHAEQAETALSLSRDWLATDKTAAPVPADQCTALAALADIDLLVCDDAAALVALLGPLEAVRTALPRLIIGVASIFGLTGPYAGQPATEIDAQAISGVAWALGELGRAPLSLPPGIAAHQAGAMLAAACLAALHYRDAGGSGQLVDVALADVLTSYVGGNCRFYIHHGMEWHRSGRRASSSGGAYPYVILPCQDGEVCLCGRTREEWQRFVAVMGNPAWASEPRYQSLRAMGRDYPEEVDALLLPWLARHTMAELEALALANNLIVAPVRSFADVIATPQFGTRKFFRDFSVDGATIAAPGLPFRAVVTRVAEAPDLAGDLLRGPAPVVPRHSGKPLAGVRVLDFGWVWSAPWVGTILGELGAEVIKVEHGGRLDNLRLSGKIFRAGTLVEGSSREMSPMFHQVNHGKLGITLNAKEPRAVDLIRQLVETSDIVIENMSPGSMDRSGLGFTQMSAWNPRLVMLSMAAAGQFGALAQMRAYAPMMSSFVGLEALVGYPGEAPIGALNVGLADPNASAHGLVAVLAALRKARATGQGLHIDLSQIEALLGTLTPYLLMAQRHGQPAPMGNRHPDAAPHGIFPALGNDNWLSLAIRSDTEWAAFCDIAVDASWAADASLATEAARRCAADTLEPMIAAWTAGQVRDELVTRLRCAGIAASPILSVEEMWRDPQLAARKVKSAVDIPGYGSEELFRAPWHFSDFAAEITGRAPLMGEHNEQVFGQMLGLAPDEIATLKREGVIS